MPFTPIVAAVIHPHHTCTQICRVLESLSEGASATCAPLREVLVPSMLQADNIDVALAQAYRLCCYMFSTEFSGQGTTGHGMTHGKGVRLTTSILS